MSQLLEAQSVSARATQGRELTAYTPRALAGRRAVLSQRVGVAFPFTVADIVRFGAGEVRCARIEPMVDAALAGRCRTC